MFSKHKERRVEDAYEARLARWKEEHDDLVATLELARTGKGGDSSSVVLKPGESVFMIVEGAALLAMRRGPGHYEGSSQGLSLPIGTVHGRSIRYRVGGGRAHYLPGIPGLTPVDRGTMTITSTRVVFTGSSKTIECPLAKLVAIEHHPGMLALSVANRQTPTQIFYGEALESIVRRRFEIAVALAQGRGDEAVRAVGEEIDAHLAAMPSPAGRDSTASKGPSAP